MTIYELIMLYNKERDYERCVFGEYKNIPSLSFSSFLIFLDLYIERAKNAYSDKWEKDLPEWLLSCREYEETGSAPVKAYEEIIKIMALAGAILETYTSIEPDKWREDLENETKKWKWK